MPNLFLPLCLSLNHLDESWTLGSISSEITHAGIHNTPLRAVASGRGGRVDRLMWACHPHWSWQSWPRCTAQYRDQLISKSSNDLVSKRSGQAWLLSHLASAWKLILPAAPYIDFLFPVTASKILSPLVIHAVGIPELLINK